MNSAAEDISFLPRVHVIIPVHNEADSICDCLEGLARCRYQPVTLVVVDDGSTDGSGDLISRSYPGVRLLKGNGSLWWTGAVNKGILDALECRADYVCLLNSDNQVEPDFLDALVRTAFATGADCVCSRVFYAGNKRKVFFGGGEMSCLRGLWMRQGFGIGDDGETRETRWCGGMGTLIKTDVFKRAGMFDEHRFPQYFADADFCYRLRSLGGKIIWDPNSMIYNNHRSSGISYRTGRFRDLAGVLFSRKSNYNPFIALRFYWKHSKKCFLPIAGFLFFRIFCGFLYHLVRRIMGGRQDLFRKYRN